MFGVPINLFILLIIRKYVKKSNKFIRKQVLLLLVRDLALFNSDYANWNIFLKIKHFD